MKFYAINGSPRKNRNTGKMLQAALDGIHAAAGDEPLQAELVHLYDYRFQPCISCFACKRLGGSSYGRCAVNDDLTPLLNKLAEADGIIFGSPVYLYNVSAKLRCLLERLVFQYLVYDRSRTSLAPKRMPTAMIYTMNEPEEAMRSKRFPELLASVEGFVEMALTKPDVQYVCNTYQFDDYSKYKVEYYSEAEKAEYRDRKFPIDLDDARKLGVRLYEKAKPATTEADH